MSIQGFMLLHDGTVSSWVQLCKQMQGSSQQTTPTDKIGTEG
jgi:hypothetical protein